VTQELPDHFALFGLAQRFELDLAELSRAYRTVQARVHPDRHVGAGAAERRAAMQLASLANEAYQTLRDPLSRAEYLCRLAGAAPHPSADLPRALLEQQMQWREDLEAARDSADRTALEQLAQAAARQRETLLAQLAASLDAPGALDLGAAVQAVQALQFVDRFGAELERARLALATEA
jgi:molecular chaperone HscB